MDRIVPIDFLREKFAYDPFNGIVSFRFSAGKAKIGNEAGSVSDDGYRVLKVKYEGKRVQIAVHVLAWALHYGTWPENDVDHRDTNRLNNKLENLRDAPRSLNLANRNPTGHLPKGVTLNKRCKSRPYQAQIEAFGKKKWLGNHATPEAAHEAYAVEARKHFGEFARLHEAIFA